MEDITIQTRQFRGVTVSELVTTNKYLCQAIDNEDKTISVVIEATSKKSAERFFCTTLVGMKEVNVTSLHISEEVYVKT